MSQYLYSAVTSALLALLLSNPVIATPYCGNYPAEITTIIKGPAVGQSGNDNDSPFRALAIDPFDANIIYVGSEGNGVFKSVDGGSTWIWLRTGLWHCDAYPEIYNIAIDSVNSQKVYLATNAGPGPAQGPYRTAIGGLYRSLNGGLNWDQINSGLSSGATNAITVSPTSSNTILATIGGGFSTNANDPSFYNGGIFISTDYGSNWTLTTMPALAEKNRFWQMIWRGTIANPVFYVFGGYGYAASPNALGLMKSLDGGQSWTSLPTPLSGLDSGYFDVSADMLKIFAGEEPSATAKTWKSLDAGNSWMNPPPVTNGPVKILDATGNRIVFAENDRLYYSFDGMTTKSLVATVGGSSHNAFTHIEISASNPSVIYAVSQGLKVFKSNDYGRHFFLISNLRKFIDSY